MAALVFFQHLNKAMDTVRKQERKKLEYLNMLYPNLGVVYRLKEMFLDIFQIKDSEESKFDLEYWCELAIESGIQPFIKFVGLLKGHWLGIINYFDTKLTNGILEGINSKIQLAKRRARIFRNINNFIYMIRLICGNVKFNYPLKTT